MSVVTNERALDVDSHYDRAHVSSGPRRLDFQVGAAAWRYARRFVAAVRSVHQRTLSPESSNKGFLERDRLRCRAVYRARPLFDITFGYVWSPTVNSCTLALLALDVILSVFPKLFHIPSVSQCQYLSKMHTCNLEGAAASDVDINGRHLPVVGAMGLTIDNLGINVLTVGVLVAAANSRYVAHPRSPVLSLALSLLAVEEAIRLSAVRWSVSIPRPLGDSAALDHTHVLHASSPNPQSST